MLDENAERAAAVRRALKFDEEGRMQDKPAARASALSLDGFVGYFPKHQELKLGAALVLHPGSSFRPSIQVADDVIGLGVAWRLPLNVFADALSISVGAGVYRDIARGEYTTSVYLARLVF